MPATILCPCRRRRQPWIYSTVHAALEYWKTRKPSVLFLSLGETDEWAHAAKYDEYVRAANRVDLYLKKIWDQAQSMPEYRGVTSLFVSVDHGRGRAPVEWRSHGQKLDETKFIWVAFLGPDTKPLGERRNVGPVTQNQIAPTLAALPGENYGAAVPKAGLFPPVHKPARAVSDQPVFHLRPLSAGGLGHRQASCTNPFERECFEGGPGELLPAEQQRASP